LFDETPGLKDPPKATLARRAKSYSDFYDAATNYLGKPTRPEKTVDVFEALDGAERHDLRESQYEKYEDDLLDGSHDEYQYVHQIILLEKQLTWYQDFTETNWPCRSSI
jgi:hypothetical protein